MSGGSRRLAAAQRTAAISTTPSRKKRLGAWIIIVPALALFSFSVVAGATGFQPKPDVASAAAKVVPTGHDTSKPSDNDGQPGQSQDGKGDQDGDARNGNGGDGDEDGGLVVVGSSHDDGGIAGHLGKHGRRDLLDLGEPARPRLCCLPDLDHDDQCSRDDVSARHGAWSQ